jgi:CRP-like cAMP-binding protein
MSPDRLTRGSGNRLIDSLPKDVAKRLSFLEDFENLGTGEVIYRQDAPTSYVYFPITAVYSRIVWMGNGQRIAAATIGNEGMLGVHVLLGLDFSPTMAVSLIPGAALRSPVPALMEAVRGSDCLDRLLKRYAVYSLRHAHQCVACHSTHSVEEQICRLLLMTHDRVGKDEFSLTHESLAEILGIRRQTVTLVARTLRAAGFIAYRRGVMRVIDRRGLERNSCECYEVSRVAYRSIVELQKTP